MSASFPAAFMSFTSAAQGAAGVQSSSSPEWMRTGPARRSSSGYRTLHKWIERQEGPEARTAGAVTIAGPRRGATQRDDASVRKAHQHDPIAIDAWMRREKLQRGVGVGNAIVRGQLQRV